MVRLTLASVLIVSCLVPGLAPGVAWAQPNRPQEPTGEVPYRSEAVVVSVPVGEDGDGGHTLAGTITLPDAGMWGDGPYPGVVLVSGSGPQNRDSEMMGHKPFLVLADRMTRAGIAVLRYDDRGVGESTGRFVDGTIPRFARDAAAAAAALRAHPAVDAERVGVMGHSEGGAVAPMVAAEHPETAFVVILAGMGVNGKEILLYQSALAYERGGQEEGWINESTRLRRALFDALGAGADDDAVRTLLRSMVEHELFHIQTDKGRQVAVDQMFAQFTGAWMRHFLTVEPAEALRRVSAPVLALNGTLDMQVPVDQNLPPIEKALAEGPCPSVTTVRLAGLNHMFQPAGTGMFGEYGVIETTFDEATMGLISGWILGVVGSGGGEEE